MFSSANRLLTALACMLLAVYVHATPISSEERSIREAYDAFKYARGLSARDVVAPPIIKPDATSVWPIGTSQEVVWDTSKLPPDNQITNPRGRILLGRDTGDSLNLDLDHPLAEGFHIRQGRINITVPNVTPRPDYLIVLMGNSGNTSPSFAITQIAGDGGSTDPPSLPPPVFNPTPSLPGIVPTRSSRPAVVTPTASDILPTTLISTPISEDLPTAPSSAASEPAVSSPAQSEPLSNTRSSSASQPSPSDLNQEGEDAGAALRSGLNTAAFMCASLSVFLVAL